MFLRSLPLELRDVGAGTGPEMFRFPCNRQHRIKWPENITVTWMTVSYFVFEAGDTEVKDVDEQVEPGDGEGVPPETQQVRVNALQHPQEADEQVARGDRTQQVLHGYIR